VTPKGVGASLGLFVVEKLVVHVHGRLLFGGETIPANHDQGNTRVGCEPLCCTSHGHHISNQATAIFKTGHSGSKQASA
jgi:hypothetical protein